MVFFVVFRTGWPAGAFYETKKDNWSWWKLLYVTKKLYPDKIHEGQSSSWTTISPTHKFIISIGSLLFKLKDDYGENSQEFSCTLKFANTKLQKINLQSYDFK
ncbi:MAG: hypothetical protein R3D58_12915 [Saprospiraceae bacterium]